MPSRSAAVGNMRSRRPIFQRADWMWQPIPASPVLDSQSSTIAAALATGTHIADLVDYGVTMRGPAGITSGTPRYDITFSQVPSWGPDPFPDTMPIPAGLPIATGSDKHLAVADPSHNRAYHLWQWNGTSGASWGGWADLNGDGRDNPSGSSTGCGLARFAGVITVAEIAAGRIDHALFFSTSMARPTTFRYPATRTDGTNDGGGSTTIPEGARVQLDPTINLAAISGITQAELIVGRALQTYGAYCGDNGGAKMAFIFELASDFNYAADYPGAVYSGAGFANDYFNMTHIPWSSLRVLAQWDGGGAGGSATVPGAPTIGTATAGNASATVAFTAPASDGGATITGYTATSTPGTITGTGSSSPITVSGLTNGTAYTFKVKATNSAGTGLESAASNSVTPTASGSAPVFVAYTTAAASTTSGNVIAAAPAGVASGHYQLAAISIGTASETITSVPSGWTLVGSATGADSDTYQLLVYASTTATGSSTWVKSGTREAQVVRAAWSGVASAGSHSGPTVNGTGTTHATGSVTPGQANSKVVGICAIDGAATTFTPPAGWTERVDSYLDLQAITVADVTVGASATTGTFTSSASDEALVFAIVLNPS